MTSLLLLMLVIPLTALILGAILDDQKAKLICVISTASALAISVIMLALVLTGSASLLANVSLPLFNQIPFSLALTPVSIALVLMSSIVLFSAIVAGNPEQAHIKSSSLLIILFQLAAYGLFLASNLFVFFIFWELGIIALFFMIYLLGSPNRRQAALKFLIYELFASALLLLAIVVLYVYVPAHDVSFSSITAYAVNMPQRVQLIVFISLLMAFITNMPIFPLHLWLPDAHSEASTQGSMLLSGILTKFGAFGLLLTFELLPIAHVFAPYVAALAVISSIYAAFVLITQTDIKRIVAYTTIVELSIIALAITSMNSIAYAGATYAMLAHGLTVALMFLAAGMLKHAFGVRDVRVLSGIVDNLSHTVYSFLLGTFAMVGLPLTAGFVGELLMFIGAFNTFGIFALLPLLAIVIMGGYLYAVIARMISKQRAPDLINPVSFDNKTGYMVLLCAIFIFGTVPLILTAVLTKV